ncbi:hypothetical protein DR66_3739 [Delftia acidovorans]|nr:hypothetical protein DR66_3739 [Delftia acidovorans]
MLQRGGQVVAYIQVAEGVAVVDGIQGHHAVGRDVGDVAVELVGVLVPSVGRPLEARCRLAGQRGIAPHILRPRCDAEGGLAAIDVLVQPAAVDDGRGAHIADDAVRGDGARGHEGLELGDDLGVCRGDVVVVALVREVEAVQRCSAGTRAAPDIADDTEVGDVVVLGSHAHWGVLHGQVGGRADLARGMDLLARGGVSGDHLVFDAARPPVDGHALHAYAHADRAPVAIGEQAVAGRARDHGGAVSLWPVTEFHGPTRCRLGPLQHAVGRAVDDGIALPHAARQGRQVAVGAFCTDGEGARTHIARHLRIGVAHAVFVVAGGELADVETVGRAERGLYAHGRGGPAVIAAVAAVFESGLAD